MTRKAIASIDCEIPGSLSKFVPFESLTSLLDWDIIMFNPSITEFTISYDSYQGKPSLSADRSFRLKEASDHWKRELSEASSLERQYLYSYQNYRKFTLILVAENILVQVEIVKQHK